MIFATGVAILTSIFPVGKRGKALGINNAAIYIGLSLGPFMGGFLTQNFGWRSIFLINLPLGLAAMILILRKLSGEWAHARGESFDLVGSILYSVALGSLIYSLSLPDKSGLPLLIAGTIGLMIFILWEAKTQSHSTRPYIQDESRLYILQSSRINKLCSDICCKFSPQPISAVR